MRSWIVAAAMTAAVTANAAPRTRVVDVPPHDTAARFHPDDGGPVRTIYLNPCTGGCTVTALPTADFADDDATADKTIVLQPPGSYSLSEFAFGSASWASIVSCVQQVYSAYDVQVVDQRPASGVYNETLVAGIPGEGNEDRSTLGIAPVATDCSPLSNEVAIVFANADPGPDHVTGVCWTVAQESAHIYGLDHEFEFVDAAAPTPPNSSQLPSTCSDPMTYQTDCGGQKFFRDYGAKCGEFGPPEDNSPRACRCGSLQNSHAVLMKVFGAGTPTWTAPTSAITRPATGDTIQDSSSVIVKATAQRGIEHVELVLNGAVWADTLGDFSSQGLPGSDYSIALPNDVPDGVIDIVARAHDDLGGVTDSATVTVTKGAPCSDASTCAAHQSCDGSGRCVYPTATAKLGDGCSFDAECESSLCAQGACTQNCDTLDSNSCPSDFTCKSPSTDSTAGSCEAGGAGGGCCSTGGSTGAGMSPLLALGVLGVISRRRRRRSRRCAPSATRRSR
nr:hypothetical protein [Kofleriaceae bacterium]